jgi:hypothetical protein
MPVRVPVLLAAAAAALSTAMPMPAADVTVDVLVIGGTSGGLAAGIAAANGVARRHTALVMEAQPMIGGMGAAGGVGLMNQGAGLAGVTGLSAVWARANGAAYEPHVSPPPLNTFPSPAVMAASWWAMVNATQGLTVRLGCRLTAVARGATAGCLSTATFLCEGDTQVVTVAASIFVDATYDGEAMVAAGGIDYVSGREGSAEFNESLAGFNLLDDPNESFDKQNLTVSATFANGTLLPRVQGGPLPALGTGDDRLMAFSYFP